MGALDYPPPAETGPAAGLLSSTLADPPVTLHSGGAGLPVQVPTRTTSR